LEVHLYTSLYPITALAAPRFCGRSLAILATLLFSSRSFPQALSAIPILLFDLSGASGSANEGRA
jgi:hypothetical protein